MALRGEKANCCVPKPPAAEVEQKRESCRQPGATAVIRRVWLIQARLLMSSSTVLFLMNYRFSGYQLWCFFYNQSRAARNEGFS
ncbi:hypothetical protein CRG98_040323 [Punica granatum]|uniref:Uncharacterized protein n=1 Tax=Punica granatum TaxID=22663 RepID=A0A2I0I5L4_PUNGR|nr:hypothetical protein CRG98_040323 [Punica granatum]